VFSEALFFHSFGLDELSAIFVLETLPSTLHLAFASRLGVASFKGLHARVFGLTLLVEVAFHHHLHGSRENSSASSSQKYTSGAPHLINIFHASLVFRAVVRHLLNLVSLTALGSSIGLVSDSDFIQLLEFF